MSAQEPGSPHFSHLDEALSAFEEALRLIDEDEQPASYGVVLHDIAQTYEIATEFEIAIDHYRESAMFKRQAGDQADTSVTLVALANCLIESGLLDEASSTLDEAVGFLDLSKPRISSIDFAFGNHEVGLLYERLGRKGQESAYDDALSAYQRALAHIDKKVDPASYGSVVRDAGDVYQATGRLSESVSAYSEAASLFRASDGRAALISVLIDLGRVNRRLAEADGEKFLSDEALQRSAAQRRGRIEENHPEPEDVSPEPE